MLWKLILEKFSFKNFDNDLFLPDSDLIESYAKCEKNNKGKCTYKVTLCKHCYRAKATMRYFLHFCAKCYCQKLLSQFYVTGNNETNIGSLCKVPDVLVRF
jgi:hypothetical protein